MHKGANQLRKRNALGRGLSALMAANAVQIDVGPQAEEQEGVASALAEKSGSVKASSSLPGGEKTDLSVSSASPVVALASTMPESAPRDLGLTYLSIDRLVPTANQPRQRFSDEELGELAQSIAQTGLLQPILVRRFPGESGPLGRFQIVAGERRYRAALLAGLNRVPVMVRDLNEREVLEISIVENVQRAQLDPIEEAMAYQRLAEEFALSQQEIAKTVGKDRATVANALRLLKLSPAVRDQLIAGKLTAGHARALLALEASAAQADFAERIAKDGLSVRVAEEMVRAFSATPGLNAKEFLQGYFSAITGLIEDRLTSKPRANKDRLAAQAELESVDSPERFELEERFRRVLGTKVQLRLGRDRRGELRIAFYSAEELERLLEVVGA